MKLTFDGDYGPTVILETGTTAENPLGISYAMPMGAMRDGTMRFEADKHISPEVREYLAGPPRIYP